MDVNDLRIAVTVSSLVLFLALVAFTWSRKRTREYEAAEMLPFMEDASAKLPEKNQGETR